MRWVVALAVAGGLDVMADVQPSADLLEAVLPAEAPAGHECWTKVKYNANVPWPLANFKFERGTEKITFQTTLGACGSPEVCERVARACYLKFEEGATIDKVKQYRKTIYDQLKELRGKPNPKPKGSPSASPGSVEMQVEEPAAAPAPAVVAAPVVQSPEPSASAAERVHTPIVFDSSNNCVKFTYEPNPGEKKKSFSVSVARCGGSFDIAKIVVESCLEVFVTGASVEEMELRRKLMYDKYFLKAVAEGQGGDKESEAATEAPEAMKKETDALATALAAEIEAEELPAVLASPSPLAPADSEALDFEDAPADSDAWRMVKHDRIKGSCHMYYTSPDGKTQRFQTTTRAVNEDVDEAMRIARLCYVKLEAGASIQEVKEFRYMLYDRARGEEKQASGKGKRKKAADPAADASEGGPAEGSPTAESAPPQKRRRSGGSTSALKVLEKEATTFALKVLEKEGRLQDALLIEGRDPGRKNASVNGVYATIPGGFGGVKAYEKFGDKRFLYFWPGKSRWKISDLLGDEAKGFAFLQVDDGGKRPPVSEGREQLWQVFDGKGEGYGKDPAMKCTELGGDAVESTSSTAAPAPETDLLDRFEKDVFERQEQSSASPSSGSSSDSDSATKSSVSGAPEPSPTQPAHESTGAPTDIARSNGTSIDPPIPRGMVCAKMLARSLLRCHCHFVYVRQCPSRGA